MKNSLYRLLILLLCSITFVSCVNTNVLTLEVTEPAPVYLPTEIDAIGIVVRSEPTGRIEESIDILDKILSAEGKNLDNDAVNAAIMGVYDELSRYTYFSEVKIIDEHDLTNVGLGVLPSALPWQTVNDICKKNEVDVLLVLSFFDTETKIDYKTKIKQSDTPIGEVPLIEHNIKVSTLIKSGWRVYDPIDKVIRDEVMTNEYVTTHGSGLNPLTAVEAIIGRREAILDVSRNIGYNYAVRLLPYRINVTRYYFVRGTDNFVFAKRRAQTGNWNGAAELWYKEVTNPDGKIAGRACYNMAIINEINGNLDKAIEWASKSYAEYNNSTALHYLRTLQNRKIKNEKLKKDISE